MAKCPHCKGTGEAPVRLRQECLGCQRKATLEFSTYAEMAAYDGRFYCKDCKKEGNRK